MNIKQTMRNVVLGALLLIGGVIVATPLTAQAASCGNVSTSIISCSQNSTDTNGNGRVDPQETGIWGILKLAVNILTAGVGVLALAGIVYGAILYTTAGGSSEQVKKAMGIFTNVVIGVVAFGGMWVLLNFLIPGGAFNGIL